MSNPISKLAERITDDSFFFASALWDYAHSEHLDDEALARTLGCSNETLALLRLCRRPRNEPAAFQVDINDIAVHFSVQADMIAEVARRANALDAMRRAATKDHGRLMAARDRQDNAERSQKKTGGAQ